MWPVSATTLILHLLAGVCCTAFGLENTIFKRGHPLVKYHTMVWQVSRLDMEANEFLVKPVLLHKRDQPLFSVQGNYQLHYCNVVHYSNCSNQSGQLKGLKKKWKHTQFCLFNLYEETHWQNLFPGSLSLNAWTYSKPIFNLKSES